MSIKARIVILGGDGIGPEVTHEGVRVLEAVASRFGHEFKFEAHLIGGAAIDATQSALPASTLSACGTADAVLLGAVGGPKWSDPNATVRPEQGLLALRKGLGLFANLRPVTLHPALLDASPIKAGSPAGHRHHGRARAHGRNLLRREARTADSASDLCTYTVEEIQRVTRVAGRLALRSTQVDRLGRQGERAGNIASVAQHVEEVLTQRVSGCEARTHAGRLGRDASDPQASELRCASLPKTCSATS